MFVNKQLTLEHGDKVPKGSYLLKNSQYVGSKGSRRGLLGLMFVRGMWAKVLETVVFVTIWPPSIQSMSEEKQCLAEQKCFVKLSLI